MQFLKIYDLDANTGQGHIILHIFFNFDKRNFLITFLFMNKYQANNLHTFSSSNNYDVNEILEIQKTSPLRVQNQIIPENEKRRLINKYSSFINDKHEKPDLIILNKKDIISKILEKKEIHYKIISTDELYITLIKNN